MIKLVSIFLLGSILFICTSCSNCCDKDDLNTIPVTNNPLIVPDHGSSIPGIPSSPR